MTYVLDAPVRFWACPSCDTVDRTQQATPHTQMHACPALNMTLPLVEVPQPDARPGARHVPVMREDYAGNAAPLTAVRTERTDGSNDCTVLVETAVLDISGRSL